MLIVFLVKLTGSIKLLRYVKVHPFPAKAMGRHLILFGRLKKLNSFPSFLNLVRILDSGFGIKLPLKQRSVNFILCFL